MIGKRAIPTLKEVIAELPVLVWWLALPKKNLKLLCWNKQEVF